MTSPIDAVTCYMCKIEFEEDINDSVYGVTLYSSVKDLVRVHECAWECGILQVEVKVNSIMQKDKPEDER